MQLFELSALVIGFLGSFHCVAMCGPIVISLSGGNENTITYLTGRTIYNLGRIVTYSLLGMMAGLAGHTLELAGFQKSISIGIGILMIVAVISSYYLPGKSKTNPLVMKLHTFIKRIFSNVLIRKSKLSLFTGGLANGILPCGFVYLAMAGAASTQTPLGGAGYMILFGLGTFPAMMAVAAFGKLGGIKVRKTLAKAAPVLMIALGVYFIYRGYSMNTDTCCKHDSNIVENTFF